MITLLTRLAAAVLILTPLLLVAMFICGIWGDSRWIWTSLVLGVAWLVISSWALRGVNGDPDDESEWFYPDSRN